jgi:hypothetical protein
MDLLILIILMGALVGASARWGYDSRDTICLKEQELAAWGFTWHDLHTEPAARIGRRRVIDVPSTQAIRAADRRR